MHVTIVAVEKKYVGYNIISVCVCVCSLALVIRHGNSMRRITLLSGFCLAVNGMFAGKFTENQMCVFDFFYNICINISHCEKN